MLENELNTMLHDGIINDNNVYPLIFISYMINKYNLKIDNKYDDYITFISYIKENLYSLYNQIKTNEESTILAKAEYEQLKIKYNQNY